MAMRSCGPLVWGGHADICSQACSRWLQGSGLALGPRCGEGHCGKLSIFICRNLCICLNQFNLGHRFGEALTCCVYLHQVFALCQGYCAAERELHHFHALCISHLTEGKSLLSLWLGWGMYRPRLQTAGGQQLAATVVGGWVGG